MAGNQSIQSYFKRAAKPGIEPAPDWSASKPIFTSAPQGPVPPPSKRIKIISTADEQFILPDYSHPSSSSSSVLTAPFRPPSSIIPRSSSPVTAPVPTNSPNHPGDGFTKEEIERSKDPLNCVFNPTREYEKYVIGALKRGPNASCICGRVVNMSVTHGRSKSEAAAKGWVNLVVSDGTGGIMVKLYFSSTAYPLTLGTLLTIWTPLISTTSSLNKDATYVHPSCTFATSIFPGRDSSVNITIHSSQSSTNFCRLPIGYQPGKPLPNIMTLKALIEEGHELEETRVLIAVKSIGAVKKITSKKDPPTTSELVEVICFDDTAEIILLLWRETAMSAKDWRASETLLLLTRPSYRQIGKWGSKSILSLTAKSMVDVDPSSEWQDAKWLRTWLSDLRKKECLHQPSLDGIFDELLETDDHALFSLRDIDQWVRESPKRSFVGWLSLVVLNLNLSLMIARSMLCVSECCGIPIYANLLSGTCKQCDKIVPLALNPGIVGKLLDETGDIGQGKLVWTEEAWEMLWGRSVDELCVMGSKEIGLLESRVLGLRFSFLFGWEESIGRLAVLEVRM